MKSPIIPAGDRVCAENAACSRRPVQAAPQDPAVLHQALLPPGPGQRPPARACSSRLASNVVAPQKQLEDLSRETIAGRRQAAPPLQQPPPPLLCQG